MKLQSSNTKNKKINESKSKKDIKFKKIVNEFISDHKDVLQELASK